MAKQLNVNLAFTADTTKVKQDLQDLQNTLSRLTANSAQKSPLGITDEVKAAIPEIAKLEAALKNATTSTGSLDLGKFKTELNQAGLTVDQISDKLRTFGAEGTKAFAQLTQSIMSAEIPLKQTSTLLSNFATTLKNTARWQISSSILHGFMGSIQTAYTYAQNLNKSLNNIRIVTGYSADEMANFAKEANEAAQALSTTTTEYTNASLIYYQQGLDDDAVKERTDATVKMANVVGESAEEVSQQMTAIWNNFDDGSKSLEYYADVVTALGAATASSSDEIAQGLEKFAAAADTVGLSYEYATAALATVTATTRQSADVVGNAFKTLFSRMQGLKLGETLDDGTDLNKYSKALDAVGISIKTTDGQLKEMDQILDELGTRWQTLSKDQQMALAQTVAGVRQYTQLIALMDNWDFFEQNVSVAKNAEGTLQEQFEIYEEGWEAAQKRFKAAMQDVYTQILNDDFFIDLTNTFTKIIQSVEKIIESFGGLKGLLPGISALLFKMFGPDMSAAMDRFVENIKLGTQAGREAVLKERQEFATELQKIQGDTSLTGSAMVDVYREQGKAQDALIQKARELSARNTSLTEQEQIQISKLMDYNNTLGEIKIKEAERLETLQKETQELERQAATEIRNYSKKESSFNRSLFKEELNELKELETVRGRAEAIKSKIDQAENKDQAINSIKQLIKETADLTTEEDLATEQAQALWEAVENLSKSKGPKEQTEAYKNFDEQLKRTREQSSELRYSLEEQAEGNSKLLNTVNKVVNAKFKDGQQTITVANASNNYTQSIKSLDNAIGQLQGKIATTSEKFVAFGSMTSSFAMSLQSINSIVNTWNNPDLSGWDKFLNITMSLGMLIPSLVSSYTKFIGLFGKQAVLAAAKTATIKAQTAAEAALVAKEAEEIAFEKAYSAIAEVSDTKRRALITELRAEVLARKLNLSSMEEEEGKTVLLDLLKEKNIKLSEKEIEALYQTIIAKELEAKASIKQAESEELDNIAKKRSADANKRLSGSLNALTSSAGIFVAILAVAAAALFVYTKRVENAAEAQKKAADEASENAKKTRDEIEAHQELFLSYEELIDKYKKGEIQKSELYDITNELAEAYDIEGAAIANLTGQYDDFTESVKKASEEEIKRQKQLESKAFKASTEGMVGAGVSSEGVLGHLGNLGSENDYNFTLPTSMFDIFEGSEYNQKKSKAITEAYTKVTGKEIDINVPIQFEIKNANDPEQVIKYYEDLLEYRRLLVEVYDIPITDSTVIGLDKQLKEIDDYYDQAIDHAKNYNNLLIQEIANSQEAISLSTTEEVKELKESLEKELVIKGISIDIDEAEQMVKNYLQNLNSDVVNRALAEEELALKGHSQKVIQTYLDLSDAERETLATFGVKLDYYINDENAIKLKQDIEDALTLGKFKDIEVSIPVNLALDINESVRKGKTVNKETWEELTAAAPRAEEILGERDEFNNKSIAERLRLINELNKALLDEGIEIANLDEAQKKSYENRKKEVDAQIEKQLEYKNSLKFSYDQYNSYEEYAEEIKKANNELDRLRASQDALNKIIEGSSYDAAVSALSNTINSLLSDINLVQDATELIGENWTIAAENVEQFARLMPEILNNEEELNFLEDGSLKLTKEQVATVLNGNKEIINSNKEVVISSIENKIEQLKIENEYYKKQVELLKESLSDHSKYNDNLKEMDKNTREYANKLEELGVQVDSQSWDQIIDHSAKGAEAVQENLQKIYNRIEEIHDAYGKMLTSDKELGGFNIEGVTEKSLGDGEWRADVSTDDIDSYWGDKAKIFEEQIDSYQKAIEKNEDLIAQYTGAIANIKSGTKEVGEAIDRVNSGQAGKAAKVKGASKNNEPDKKDLLELDKELDRYYDINNAISKINQELERQEQIEKRLSKYQEHYAGKTLIKSLEKQNDLLKKKNTLLNDQYKNYEKLYEIQAEELGELKGKIGGNWNGNELTNYAELFQANVDKYNAVVSAYNAMTKEQQQASGKQMVEDAKKAYDKYKEALERYQTLYYNEMYDTENKLAEYRQQQLENQFKIIENNLKSWETEVQLKLDMTGLKRDWKAFIKDVETDFRKIYENLSLTSAFDTETFGTHLEDAATRMQQIADVEAEIDKMEASKDANGAVQISDDMMFGSISEAQEYLKKLQGELIDTGNSLNSMYKQVWDNYIKGLDQAKDNFEDINKEIEHLTNQLEYEKELIELIYGDKAYDMMDRYYSAQQKSIETRIDSTRQQAQFWEDQFNKAFEMNRDAHNVKLNDMSTWTEDMRKAYDEMIESQEKLNDLVLDGIKNLKDEYLNNVAKTLSEMDKAIWGMDLDDLKEDWDFLQKKADEYLDDVEGAYKIQSLANKIAEGIEKTTNPKAQQKLAKLREDELEMLREKEHLTQSDLDIAEARYEIALKEIALEEAQENKTAMKLTRDTSGNWTYQYVADNEDVANKRQELLDAYNNLYETADNAYNHAIELAMEMYEEYRDKLAEIAEDTTLTEEEKLLRMQELQQQYLEEIQAALENAQLYDQEALMAGAAVFQEVCDQDAEAYQYLTDLQMELVDMVKDQHLEDYEEIRNAVINNYQEIGDKAKEVFNETNINSQTAAAAMIDQWDKDDNNSVKGAMNDAFNALVDYTKNFENELYFLEMISGMTIMDQGGVVDDINNISYAIEEVGYKTGEMVDTAGSYLDNLRTYVKDVAEAWDNVVYQINEAITALQAYLRATEAVNAEEARREAEAAKRAADEARQVAYSSSGSGSGSSSGSGSGAGVRSAERSSNKESVKLETDPYGVSGTIGLWDGQKYVGIAKSNREGYEELLKKYGNKYNITGTNLALIDSITKRYDTGGYTGDWDSQSGKLAFLHQKELVLNATDTENMLAAVNSIRDIAGLNQSISETIASSIGRLIVGAMNAGGANISTINNSSGDTSNNTFNITAEFPNANDVQTIRDAILSLPNLASQFVHDNNFR